MEELKAAGGLPKWGSKLAGLERRNCQLYELKSAGILTPNAIGVPSVRNDAAFLATTVVGSSLLAIVASQILPGNAGPAAAYIIGGIGFVVPAIGSVNPGLLEAGINAFSTVFPDYRERVVKHEAGHFLAGYLTGVPVGFYSLNLGTEHTDFVDAKISRRLIESTLTNTTVDSLAVVAMAGPAAEASFYEEVVGQNADLSLLQRVLNRSENKISNPQQQSITRWATYTAGKWINSDFKNEYDALVKAMTEKKTVYECIQAIENA